MRNTHKKKNKKYKIEIVALKIVAMQKTEESHKKKRQNTKRYRKKA
jgi:hypothetical protein